MDTKITLISHPTTACPYPQALSPKGKLPLPHPVHCVCGLLIDLSPRTRIFQIRGDPYGLSPALCSLQNHLKLNHMPKSSIQALPELWQASYGSSCQLVQSPVSSEEPLQEWPVLLFWLQGYWAKTTKPLNICLHTGSEPNYLPLLLMTHFG